MGKRKSILTAGAGEHYVAYVLCKLGYIAALPRQGSPTADILAADLSGQRTLAIQVKTTEWAERFRGRGSNKVAFQVQCPLGHRAVEATAPEVVFAFVDLRGSDVDSRPDVYVIPAKDIHEYYKGYDIRKHPYVRLHWPIEVVEKYKNNWGPVYEALGDPGASE